MADSGLLIVISGFSGSGKGTIMKELIRRYPEKMHCQYQLPRVSRGKVSRMAGNISSRQKKNFFL